MQRTEYDYSPSNKWIETLAP